MTPGTVTKRPLSVTIIGWLFVAVGIVGLVYHASEFTTTNHPIQLVLVCFVRLLAIVFGAFILRGHNWARWGILLWIACHVVLSAFHSVFDVVMHGVLLAIITCFLVRPRASAYFRNVRQNGTHSEKP